MTTLVELIRAEIERAGPISFARYMELALYHPELGYYEQRRPVGRRGDYYTSVSAGALFGELLAFAFTHWGLVPEDRPLQIVEGGAHDGQLARDILAWYRSGTEFKREVEYWLVEPSALRRAWQGETLGDLARSVRWVTDWDDIPTRSIEGVIFANELLDALPVQRWGWDAASRSWFEWGVGLTADQFVWVRLADQTPAAGQGTRTEPGLGVADCYPLDAGLLAVLPDGFTVETCPAALQWWRRAAESLGSGRLLTFDYGLPAEDLLAPTRSRGTLRAYRGHVVAEVDLGRPGEQDLTAHVNFSALRVVGERAGLGAASCESQGDFLVRVLGEIERDPGAFAPWTAARRRQLRTLVHPEHLGRAFHVLAQSRGVRS